MDPDHLLDLGGHHRWPLGARAYLAWVQELPTSPRPPDHVLSALCGAKCRYVLAEESLSACSWEALEAGDPVSWALVHEVIRLHDELELIEASVREWSA